MDIRMPGMDGVEATRRIRSLPARSPATDGPDASDSPHATDAPRVLILTTFDLDEYVYAALRAGASGFLLKDALADDLLDAVRAVAIGEAVTAPSVTRRLIAHYVDYAPTDLPIPGSPYTAIAASRCGLEFLHDHPRLVPIAGVHRGFRQKHERVEPLALWKLALVGSDICRNES